MCLLVELRLSWSEMNVTFSILRKQAGNILDSLHLQTLQGTEMIEAEAFFLQDFSKHVCKKSFGALH